MASDNVRISQKTVDGATAAEKDHFVWDRDLKGFGLRVSKGGTKSYVVQYRMGGRGFKSKRRTIGRAGSPWTPQTARAEAERLLHLVGLGHDPELADRENERQQLYSRFDQLAEHFLKIHGERNWAPGTLRNKQSDVERWLLPVLKRKPLAAITRRDITDVLDRVPAGSPALPRNLFVLMRTIFNWAVDRGEIEKSPMQGMKAPKSAPERHHILSDDELVMVAAAAPKLGKVWGNMVHLLILTAQRLREVAHADWSEFDRDAAEWRIPARRTKNRRAHSVPLNQAAIAVLDECAGNAGEGVWPRSGLVFTHGKNKQVSGFSKAKTRLDRLLRGEGGETVRPWRLHDLRRTTTTGMQRIGVQFEVTEAILNHVSITQAGVASVYHRHDWASEKRAAFDAWGNKLLEMIGEYQKARWPKVRVGVKQTRGAAT